MTINPPVFSIVTVTKDNITGLRKTAQSVTSQGFRDYQWIIVDGNSTDGTQEYLQTLPADHISENDNGIYHAMNKGIARAHGRYLVFMNAGDAFSDIDILSTVARAISAENPDFVYGDALESNGLYKKARRHKHIDRGMFTHHQAMFYKRGKLNGLRYDETLKIAADYGLTAAFLKNADTVHYIPCAVCIFEDGGISQQRRTLGRQEQFSIRKSSGISSFKNAMIYCLQSISAALREQWPRLYFKLRA